MYLPINYINICIVKTFTWFRYHNSFSKNWLRTSFWKQLLGKYISPELDPDPDLAVKIPDPRSAKRSGSDRIRIPTLPLSLLRPSVPCGLVPCTALCHLYGPLSPLRPTVPYTRHVILTVSRNDAVFCCFAKQRN
jgi:hypothetical protein